MSEINQNQIKGLPTGVTGVGGGISGIYVLNAGVTLGQFNSINVHGPGVTASATGTVADIYITGGGGITGAVGPSSWERFFLIMGG